MRAWDIRIDESFFLGGLDKGMFLKKFGAPTHGVSILINYFSSPHRRLKMCRR
jgi:hypothetical protein